MAWIEFWIVPRLRADTTPPDNILLPIIHIIGNSKEKKVFFLRITS